MKRKFKGILIFLIIILISILLYINNQEKPETVLDELFNNLSNEKIYNANMLFLSNYNNRKKISKKYKDEMSIGDKTEIGYNEYFSNESYMKKYLKKVTYNITDVIYSGDDVVIINIIIKKPDYDKYIAESFTTEGNQSIEQSTQKFINYMNSENIKYVKSSGYIYMKKINRTWRIDFQDNMAELFY